MQPQPGLTPRLPDHLGAQDREPLVDRGALAEGLGRGDGEEVPVEVDAALVLAIVVPVLGSPRR